MDYQTPNLEHYMTYTEEELLPTANILLNYILEPIQHESLYKKYAHKRYLKVGLDDILIFRSLTFHSRFSAARLCASGRWTGGLRAQRST